MTRGRLIAGLLIVGGLVFALWGGEYSTLDWWKLKRQVRSEREQVRRLMQEVDSLQRWARQLETDPVTQERRARERFGMIRDGEILYRIEPVR